MSAGGEERRADPKVSGRRKERRIDARLQAYNGNVTREKPEMHSISTCSKSGENEVKWDRASEGQHILGAGRSGIVQGVQ